jgi:hypothetical protein
MSNVFLALKSLINRTGKKVNILNKIVLNYLEKKEKITEDTYEKINLEYGEKSYFFYKHFKHQLNFLFNMYFFKPDVLLSSIGEEIIPSLEINILNKELTKMDIRYLYDFIQSHIEVTYLNRINCVYVLYKEQSKYLNYLEDDSDDFKKEFKEIFNFSLWFSSPFELRFGIFLDNKFFSKKDVEMIESIISILAKGKIKHIKISDNCIERGDDLVLIEKIINFKHGSSWSDYENEKYINSVGSLIVILTIMETYKIFIKNKKSKKYDEYLEKINKSDFSEMLEEALLKEQEHSLFGEKIDLKELEKELEEELFK